jgi:hypothetical protein
VSLRRLAKKQGLYETSHLISQDGGNITMFFTRAEPLIADQFSAVIPGNCEWISRIVRQHTVWRHHFSSAPYVRAWQRLCRSLNERRETAVPSSGKAILDGLYVPHVQAHSPPSMCMKRDGLGMDEGPAS